MDAIDRKLLDCLQADATMPLAEIAEHVGLSATPCWRRIQKMEKNGIILGRVALLDATKLNVGVTVFLSIKTSQHSREWLEEFANAVVEMPEVAEFYRMSGEVDYQLRVVVPDIAAYDLLLQAAHRKSAVVGSKFELRDGADQIHDGSASKLCAYFGRVHPGSRRQVIRIIFRVSGRSARTPR